MVHPKLFRESCWLTLISFTEQGGEVSILTTLSMHREKLHMKLFPRGSQSTPIKEDRPTYREQFVPPEISMVSCFATKVSGRFIDCRGSAVISLVLCVLIVQLFSPLFQMITVLIMTRVTPFTVRRVKMKTTILMTTL